MKFYNGSVIFLMFLFIYGHVTVIMREADELPEQFESSDIHTPVTSFELTKLLIFLNSMKDNNREMFLKRIQINEKETSLSEFIENAWDRKLNFQFESSFAPVYVLCHDKNTNTMNRRGGAVLEVVAKNRRTDRLESNRWIAVFRYESRAGYYLEHLKDLETIQIGKETKENQEEIVMDSIYTCPFKKEMNAVINRKLEGMKQTREELISRKIIREWKQDEYDF